MRRIRDNSQYLNRLSRRDDIKDSVKNVLGNIFHWPTALVVPVVPTVGTPVLSKIEETPVAPSVAALTVPAVPTVAGSTSVKGFTEISGVSISIATPCVVTAAGHGIAEDEIIKFTTTGALPTGLTAFTYYFCKYVDENSFQITPTTAGAAINTTGSQSGTQSVWHET